MSRNHLFSHSSSHARKSRWSIASSLILLSALCTVTLTARVAPKAIAQGNTESPLIHPPRPVPPIWPPRPMPPVLNQELQLVSQDASVEIKGALAHTKLTQTFQNTTGRRIEGTYVFPLPEGASVSGFAMTVNGKRMEAEFLEGDKAREIYQGIVAKLRDPAILEFIDRNMIRAKVFPIEPGATQVMELAYSQTLRADAGSFRYVVPLRLPVGGNTQRGAVDIRITSPDGIKSVYSPTHEIEVKHNGNSARVTSEFGSASERRISDNRVQSDGLTPRPRPGGGTDRDFVLYYTTSRAKVGVNLITHKEAGEDGYFMLLIAPDSQIAQTEIAAKDVVFVFDTSGSMQGEKIEQARKALLNLLGNLNPRDRFNIVTFSSDTRTFRDGLVSADKSALDAARDWAKNIKAVGGTNINEALIESIKMLQIKSVEARMSSRAQQIVFMTDGQPTVGETNVEQILKNVRTSNEATELHAKGDTTARLFVFGVGYDVNTRLLDTLAEENRGSSDYVLPEEDIETKVGSLYNKIAFPVMANPRLDWNGAKVYDVYPKVLPDLFKGTQQIVFGRYGGGRGIPAPQLIGSAGGREEHVSGSGDFADDKNETLPRLWATRKIGTLMDDARRSGRTIDPEVKEEITKLGKKYGIVTPFTAGLITEDEPNSPRNVFGNPGPAGAPGLAAPQAAMDADGNFGGPASGERAVRAARATKEYQSSTTLPTTTQSATTRVIAGKTFELQNGVWTDASYNPQTSPKVETIKFASPEYFTLVKDSRVAKWLSIGERVIVVLEGRTIRIEP